ncbi:transketolase [Tepiditoga spiralis]|uniref:Transketolase n=1 Tax=Tepiditoga spiralis TaxID=2108365 RepID=A0A7G1GAV8_9BACT|nr:transketolase [Tepiditoga spiralis]BBE31392.1 transketolase [Tepiditoga spiralis]
MKKSISELKKLSKICRGDILKMTYVSKSGHPGGSMSSIDIYLSVFNRANMNPEKPFDVNRDKTIISHGHTSPGVYAALGRLGFFNIEEALAGFRHPGSIFEGHVTRGIPGIEWSTGNLGQGLSAGVGMALAAKKLNNNSRVYVLSSDGESPKGQIAEARRTAKKENLNNLTVIVDYNDIQISGRARDVLYVDIASEYKSAGWNIIEIDGHNFEQINAALESAENYKLGPTAIIAKTIIGKDVSFMENRHEYHGSPLNETELEKALKELNVENDVKKYIEMRNKLTLERDSHNYNNVKLDVNTGKPIMYTRETTTDNRSAWGNAVADLAVLNKDKFPVVTIDCDLKPSVKLAKFEKVNPEGYVQIGIQEHNAATIGGAMSTCGVLTFFTDFGVFGLDEVFNQQRLNDINHTNFNTAITHCGIDVGEDGKTHHAINYIGLVRNMYNTQLIVPADPNQTDRAIRYAASHEGNVITAMGRSKIPVILNENGEIFFNENYEFEYGKADIFRKGKGLTIFTYGSFANMAVNAADELKKEGINISVVNLSTPLSINVEEIKEFIEDNIVITYEDHNVNSGIANELSKLIVENGLKVKKIINMGVNEYAPSGSIKYLLKYFGMDVESLIKKIKELMK